MSKKLESTFPACDKTIVLEEKRNFKLIQWWINRRFHDTTTKTFVFLLAATSQTLNPLLINLHRLSHRTKINIFTEFISNKYIVFIREKYSIRFEVRLIIWIWTVNTSKKWFGISRSEYLMQNIEKLRIYSIIKVSSDSPRIIFKFVFLFNVIISHWKLQWCVRARNVKYFNVQSNYCACNSRFRRYSNQQIKLKLHSLKK